MSAGQRASEASLRQRIRSLLDENHRLRGESDGLRAELAHAYGERRDPRRDS
jgi:regulator of replication initiation timing